MTPRWTKVVRDLQQNKLRSALVMLAIAVGISGFGSVLSTYSILTRELNAGYLATNPAAATLWVNKLDQRCREEVLSFPGIAAFEERRTISARVRSGAGEWKNAQLFVMPDFRNIRISTLKPQTGKWPPGDREVLVERDAFGVAQAKIGDQLTIQTPAGPETLLKLVGSVHDPGQAQARMEQLVYGYISVNTLKLLGEEPYFDEIKIQVSSDRWNEAQIRKTTVSLKEHLEKKGYTIRRIDIPKPGAHPHADLMGTLLLFKSSFGFFALLLSGVLVIQLLTALMAGQIRQIGIMKSLGAKRSQVMGIYFRAVLLLSIGSLMFAIPVSILAGEALARFMSRFLNFDLHDLSISAWVYGLQIATGLLVPFAAAFFPIRRAAKISVRQAISDYGITQNQFGKTRFDQQIARILSIKGPFLLSIRNTFRRPARLALIVGALAVGGTIFIAAFNVRASLIHTVDVMLESFQFHLALSFSEEYPEIKLKRILENTQGVSRLEFWGGAEAAVLDAHGNPQGSPFVIAAPPASSSMLVLEISTGRSLQPGEPNALVVNNRLAGSFPKFKVGSKVNLRIGQNIQTWEIVGITNQPFAGPAAYADREFLAHLTGRTGVAKNVRILTDGTNQKTIDETKQRVEENLARGGFRLTRSISMAERRRVIDEHNSVIYTFLIVMALVIVIVGGLGLMTIMSINVLERRREIGVLRSIGATKRKILVILLGEGMSIGLMSWLIAVPISFLISTPIGNLAAGRILHTKLEISSDLASALSWLVIVIVFGALASFLPAWNATRLTVRELIQYE